MLIPIPVLRSRLSAVLSDKTAQGHATDNLKEVLALLPDSYDALAAFAHRLADLPMRADWPYVEPNEWEEIEAECDADRPRGLIAPITVPEASARVEAAFLGSVAGCILGKPLEYNPTLARIRSGLEKVGQWPIEDYVTVEALEAIGQRHNSWVTCCRGRIRFVAPDDDINYTILGMLALEQHGLEFTRHHLRWLWLDNQAPYYTFGPERTFLLAAALRSLNNGYREWDDAEFAQTVNVLNPGDELCGAMIRADAYGYAAAGNPELAAKLAWRDAGMTHRRTGIYGTMFAAAAIATAFVARSPMEIFQTAAKFVPRRSRFRAVIDDSFEKVSRAADWLEGYQSIHNKYGEYGHCRVYQEAGTLINTLRFGKNVGDGICKQVMQGNDTDSFGATCGSILGAFFGPGHLEPRWIEPFNDTLHTTLATFTEQRLSNVVARMRKLPELTLAAGGRQQMSSREAGQGTFSVGEY